MMSRSQISLDPALLKRAHRRAAELGLSFAEYIRRLVARDLGGKPKQVDCSLVFDLGSSGGADVARHKDAMLGAALVAERGEE